FLVRERLLQLLRRDETFRDEELAEGGRAPLARGPELGAREPHGGEGPRGVHGATVRVGPVAPAAVAARPGRLRASGDGGQARHHGGELRTLAELRVDIAQAFEGPDV